MQNIVVKKKTHTIWKTTKKKVTLKSYINFVFLFSWYRRHHGRGPELGCLRWRPGSRRARFPESCAEAPSTEDRCQTPSWSGTQIHLLFHTEEPLEKTLPSGNGPAFLSLRSRKDRPFNTSNWQKRFSFLVHWHVKMVDLTDRGMEAFRVSDSAHNSRQLCCPGCVHSLPCRGH